MGRTFFFFWLISHFRHVNFKKFLQSWWTIQGETIWGEVSYILCFMVVCVSVCVSVCLLSVFLSVYVCVFSIKWGFTLSSWPLTPDLVWAEAHTKFETKVTGMFDSPHLVHVCLFVFVCFLFVLLFVCLCVCARHVARTICQEEGGI